MIDRPWLCRAAAVSRARLSRRGGHPVRGAPSGGAAHRAQVGLEGVWLLCVAWRGGDWFCAQQSGNSFEVGESGSSAACRCIPLCCAAAGSTAVLPQVSRHPRPAIANRLLRPLLTAFFVLPVLPHCTCSLIQLYIDIEITDRHNTFYEKFNTRYQVRVRFAAADWKTGLGLRCASLGCHGTGRHMGLAGTGAAACGICRLGLREPLFTGGRQVSPLPFPKALSASCDRCSCSAPPASPPLPDPSSPLKTHNADWRDLDLLVGPASAPRQLALAGSAAAQAARAGAWGGGERASVGRDRGFLFGPREAAAAPSRPHCQRWRPGLPCNFLQASARSLQPDPCRFTFSAASASPASFSATSAPSPHLPLQFIHVLLNDSQYLLQDALETLPKVPRAAASAACCSSPQAAFPVA
jgi:hypothetical protein